MLIDTLIRLYTDHGLIFMLALLSVALYLFDSFISALTGDWRSAGIYISGTIVMSAAAYYLGTQSRPTYWLLLGTTVCLGIAVGAHAYLRVWRSYTVSRDDNPRSTMLKRLVGVSGHLTMAAMCSLIALTLVYNGIDDSPLASLIDNLSTILLGMTASMAAVNTVAGLMHYIEFYRSNRQSATKLTLMS